jgi:hypothetical protein
METGEGVVVGRRKGGVGAGTRGALVGRKRKRGGDGFDTTRVGWGVLSADDVVG